MVREPLILASGSPRRRELLAEMGVAFEVVTAKVEEVADAAFGGPRGVALHNAQIKAEAVYKIRPGRWILGADTVVALAGKMFAKPASLEEARDFLRALSGHTHEVITGCALVGPIAQGKPELFSARSRVTFRFLTEVTISQYLEKVHVLDKAGGYAIQEHGELIIERIEGSRTNIIGLPIDEVRRVLQRRGLL